MEKRFDASTLKKYQVILKRTITGTEVKALGWAFYVRSKVNCARLRNHLIQKFEIYSKTVRINTGRATKHANAESSATVTNIYQGFGLQNYYVLKVGIPINP